MKKMNNKGFSLVELIIVIAIMAILVGVLAPQFVKYVEQSRESSDLQTVTEIKTAVETYTADYGDTGNSTVAVNSASKTATVTGSAAGKLSEYGVQDTTTLRSTKLGTYSWTYTNYSWSFGGTKGTTANGCFYDAETGEKL